MPSSLMRWRGSSISAINGATSAAGQRRVINCSRAVAGSGPIPDGERIEARTLLDLAADWDVTPSATLFASVQNVTDEVHNVGFSPAGARPGAPRIATAGLPEFEAFLVGRLTKAPGWRDAVIARLSLMLDKGMRAAIETEATR